MRRLCSVRQLVASVVAAMCVGVSVAAAAAERPQSSATAAEGTEVKVFMKDGATQTGRLVSLSRDAVVIRRDTGDVSLTIDRVRKVERVAHYVRTGLLIGVGAAAGIVLIAAAGQDSCADCEDAWGAAAIYGAIAIGAGAGVGAILQKATAGGRVLYSAPKSAPTVSVQPVMSPRQASLAVSFRW